jgi:hypothetical protein
MKYALLGASMLFATLCAAADLRDPTRPPVVSHAVTGAREPEPVLSAVMGASGSQIAIFNGQVVRTGDSVGGYTIVNIFEDRLTYRHAGLTQTVYLPHSATIRKSPTSTVRSPLGDP